MERKCRLCLSKEKLIWIFDKRIINTNKLSDIIYNATGVNISETDPVTQMVCHECCLYTVDIYKFRIKCLINNNLLHSFVTDCKQIKTEVKKEELDIDPNETNEILNENLDSKLKSPRKRRHCDSLEGNRLNQLRNETCSTEQNKDNGSSNSNIANKENDENSAKNDAPPHPHRLMLTRARRKLKSDIEKQKLDKQKVIESLYAENIDKIMFTSYLKLAPKCEASALGNSAYKEGLINCKLCKMSIDSGSTLREHLENECRVFKMIDHMPTVDVVRVENVKSVKEKYPVAIRTVRAVKKARRIRCSCCGDGNE